MKRKRFLSSLLASPLMQGIPFSSASGISAFRLMQEESFTIPPYLKHGDTIGITCPAGHMSADELAPCLNTLESWGFKLRLGSTVGRRDFTFGGTDEERADDFQQMLDDPSLQAILCARGGYGCIRIIDRLDFRKFVARPKWIIGFSDITVIHAHLNHNYRIASIHSKMCNSFPDRLDEAEPAQLNSILSIRTALTGNRVEYPLVPDPGNKTGMATGMLTGGNLKTIETLVGSASDLHTEGMILFVEDVGEYLYSVDRMFYSLKRTGKLDRLAALLIGGFKVKPDDPGDEFGRSVYNIVLEHVSAYHYPICFNFPVGHQKVNYALKCGVKHQLIVGDQEVIFKEV
ncbi:MAG: LD-carboxypeptidase [Bacteroidota bacterium]|nr:LD-carboxypeptidase [Bacteroidota bacterium]MDP4211234.1 LD-carboxypeptidase [Bacteroidota bacterium]MDP4251142.1 LD-carboxypeptidase [Bacteroidota bacterium]